MRTKTLMIAAAALAAGALTSMAQSNVYSLNIVGYVNKSMPSGQFELLCNPLDAGTNNTLAGLFPSAPGGSSIQVWNGAGFDGYRFSLGHWRQGTTVADDVQLQPGQGFFFNAGGSATYTNTFVGSTPMAATNDVAAGIQAVGSVIPFGGSVTDTNGLNLVVPGGTTLQQWDVGSQSFNGFRYSLGSWRQGTTVTNPTINVGEGFFLNTASGVTWVEQVK